MPERPRFEYVHRGSSGRQYTMDGGRSGKWAIILPNRKRKKNRTFLADWVKPSYVVRCLEAWSC